MAIAAATSSGLSVERGTCIVLFAYDVAMSLDLDQAEKRISATKGRRNIRHRRRAPKYFQYRPAPLRVTLDAEPVTLGAYSTLGTVDLVFYDFGAVSVLYRIPLHGPVSGLVRLSEDLYDSPLLLAQSRRTVEPALALIAGAAVRPEVSDFVEDYVVFQIEAFSPARTAPGFCAAHAREIAQILRAETQPLSEQEVADASSERISFGLDDVVIVDWNGALVLDRDAEDALAVLEFANVELLEMRYLDQRLDDALDDSYEALSRRGWRPRRFWGSYGRDLRHLARLQADGAILYEGVNNALKLVGDQYLARVYRLVSERFHLAEWDASILRKLQTLQSIYEIMSDEAANRRLEVLEWIIIILIAASLLLPFIQGVPAH